MNATGRAAAPGPAAQDDCETFTLPAFKSNAGLWAVAALAAMVIGGAALAGLGEKRFPWDAVLALSLAMLPAIGIVWWLSRMAGNPEPTPLVIGREGIRAPAMAAAFIPWERIEAVSFTPSTYRGAVTGLLMVLHAKDTAAFGPGGNAFVRRMNRRKYGSDLLFPIGALDRPAQEVMAAVGRFAPEGVAMDGK